jgi:hypothetical protein
MNREDVVRRLSALRKLSQDRGAFPAEVRNRNPESLRVFLRQNSPRKYTFAEVSGL